MSTLLVDAVEEAPVAAGPAGGLPSTRGPISNWVFRQIRGQLAASRLPDVQVADPLTDDDLHLSLHCLYDLAYRGFADVAPGFERDPALLAMRTTLEDLFWVAAQEDSRNVGGRHYEAVARTDGPGFAVDAMLEDFDGPSLSRFVEQHATRRQFREFLIHRAAYQLKEADPHTAGLARLSSGARKSAVATIQFDEYGSGRAGRSHAELFAAALRAADLQAGYGFYLDRLPGTTLATGNLLSLFASRRELIAPLIGHLALFEMTSVVPMGRYSRAASRLGFGVDVSDFYDVHVVADEYHGRLGRHVLLGDRNDADELDPSQLVIGAHTLLQAEDRFTRSILAHWAHGCSSLRPGPQKSGPITEVGSGPVAAG